VASDIERASDGDMGGTAEDDLEVAVWSLPEGLKLVLIIDVASTVSIGSDESKLQESDDRLVEQDTSSAISTFVGSLWGDNTLELLDFLSLVLHEVIQAGSMELVAFPLLTTSRELSIIELADIPGL
jgi:hypothetical protein